MVGELMEHRDYSTKTHRMQTTLQNSYFTERFGRNDFEPINKQELPNATAYLMKYIEKSGERIVYSKNTPAYFVSDRRTESFYCSIISFVLTMGCISVKSAPKSSSKCQRRINKLVFRLGGA